MGTCFLQLRLVLDKGNGNRESVVMGALRVPARRDGAAQCGATHANLVRAEMTLPQFYHFLAQMQAANRLCQ